MSEKKYYIRKLSDIFRKIPDNQGIIIAIAAVSITWASFVLLSSAESSLTRILSILSLGTSSARSLFCLSPNILLGSLTTSLPQNTLLKMAGNVQANASGKYGQSATRHGPTALNIPAKI